MERRFVEAVEKDRPRDIQKIVAGNLIRRSGNEAGS